MDYTIVSCVVGHPIGTVYQYQVDYTIVSCVYGHPIGTVYQYQVDYTIVSCVVGHPIRTVEQYQVGEFRVDSGECIEVTFMDDINVQSDKKAAYQELMPAGFNERFVAYFIDALPFVLGWYVCLFLLVRYTAMEYTFWNDLKIKLFWILLYIIYQAIFSSGGRVTAGKHLLSIRIIAKSGENLSFAKAGIRAIGYFISALPLNFGYLMASFTRDKRTLHDYIAGSRVISLKPRGDFAQGLIFAASWGIIGIFLATWYYQNFVQLPPGEIGHVAIAKKGVIKLARLQEIYKRKNGTYTNDIRALAELSGNVMAFKNELIMAIDPDSLVISTSDDGQDYIIAARARNWRKTQIQINSSKK